MTSGNSTPPSSYPPDSAWRSRISGGRLPQNSTCAYSIREPHHRISAALVLSFSGSLLWACAAWRSRQLHGGRLLRRTISPPPTPSRFIVIIACNAAPARCSVAATVVTSPSPSAVNTSRASFSSRRSRSAGSRRRFAHTSDAASLAAYLNLCLPTPASLIDKDPHSLRLSGWPSGHLLRCSLHGVLPQTQGIPCLTGMNPRAFDPQTPAACPSTSTDV